MAPSVNYILHASLIGGTALELRYLPNTAILLVVRPTGNPQGLKVLKLSWDKAACTMDVSRCISGEWLMTLPGRWEADRAVGEAWALVCYSGVSATV